MPQHNSHSSNSDAHIRPTGSPTPSSAPTMTDSRFYLVRAFDKDYFALTTSSASQCLCGFKGGKVELGTHALGCSRLTGSNVSWRHNVVKTCIADFCRTNFIPVTVEPVIVKNPADGKHNRADLHISLLERNEEVYIDLVIANQLSQTHKGKSNARVEREKEGDKESKYLREVQARSGEFVTLLIEVNGGYSPQAASLINKIERMCRAISTTLQNANAQVLINAARLM